MPIFCFFCDNSVHFAIILQHISTQHGFFWLLYQFFIFIVVGNPCPPENVEPGSGVCYYVASSILYEYDDAKTACSNINMRIAVIDTATKQTFLENLGILDDAGK